MGMDASTEQWDIRGARNQSLFRAINDELHSRASASAGERLTIVCECADTGCVERIELEGAEYRHIRQEPTHFAVLPGHVYPELERVIGEYGAFAVVEKTGTAARVAAASNGTSERG